MDLQDLPPEILTLILSHLIEPPSHLIQDSETLHHLTTARLVCHAWNHLAIPSLYQTLYLQHTKDLSFKSWNSTLNIPAARLAAQRVVIFSTPHWLLNDFNSDVSHKVEDAWKKWDSGHYPAFTSAINRLAELPNLKAVEVRFSENCAGEEAIESEWERFEWEGVPEKMATRMHTLKAVCAAVVKHKWTPGHSRIRSLVLENLQNVPVREVTSSEVFKLAVEGVERLELNVLVEANERIPDYDVERVERRTFEPFLQYDFLPHFADQLTTLDISFSEFWGPLPGYFDGKVDGKPLIFPNLKSLSLGQFVIAHHDHFDWVLAQTSLTSLHMDQCHIASFIRYDPYSDAQDWKIRKDDWDRLPRDAFGFMPQDGLYSFSGTWEAVFDRIRKELPRLVDFKLSYDWRDKQGEVSLDRYNFFDHGLCPSPWIAAERNGLLDFGRLGRMVKMLEDGSYEGFPELSRAKVTRVGDERALRELVQAVRERRGRSEGGCVDGYTVRGRRRLYGALLLG